MDESSMPNIVLTVVVSLIILAVGVFAFFVTTGEIGYEKNRVETFTVIDPSVAKTCNTQYYIDSVTTVEQYNGIAWVAVSSTDYTTGPKSVVVDPSGMQG